MSLTSLPLLLEPLVLLLDVLLLLPEFLLPQVLWLLLEQGEGASLSPPPERSPVRLFRLQHLTGGGVDVVSYSARVYPCHVKVVIVIRRRILPTSTWT